MSKLASEQLVKKEVTEVTTGKKRPHKSSITMWTSLMKPTSGIVRMVIKEVMSCREGRNCLTVLQKLNFLVVLKKFISLKKFSFKWKQKKIFNGNSGHY